jgi:hypothetical protein
MALQRSTLIETSMNGRQRNAAAANTCQRCAPGPSQAAKIGDKTTHAALGLGPTSEAPAPAATSTTTRASQVKGIPTSVDQAFATNESLADCRNGRPRRRLATSASTRQTGMKSAHAEGHTTASMGTPASARAGLGQRTSTAAREEHNKRSGPRLRTPPARMVMITRLAYRTAVKQRPHQQTTSCQVETRVFPSCSTSPRCLLPQQQAL